MLSDRRNPHCAFESLLFSYNCPRPETKEGCAPGFFCNLATSNGGRRCPNKWGGRFGEVSAYCPPDTGQLQAGGRCPEGHSCPNSSVSFDCPAGTFCPQGTNQTTQCFASFWGGATAKQRCPALSKSEPMLLDSTLNASILAAVVLIVVEIIAVCHERRKEWCRPPSPPPSPREAAASNEERTSRSSTAGQPEEPGAGMGQELFPHASEFLNLSLQRLSFHIGKAAVLSNLSLEVHEGELVALMGESGSGKTTLLNVLGGRASYGVVSGDILLNHRPFVPSKLNVGFVPQSYLLFKELTVRENLVYSAALRLDRNVDAARRGQIVDAALELLGLAKVRDFVCDKNLTKAKLSGGQMRRVGIGVELVTLPSILLLDEPTSALDAVNTRLVVTALKVLSARGILVMASVHQPRFSVYQMFDTLAVLRQGEFILASKRCEALPFFAEHGFVPAEGENPADFFIEVAFGFVHSSKGVPENELANKLRQVQAASAVARSEQRAREGICSVADFDAWFKREHPTMHESMGRTAWRRAAKLFEEPAASTLRDSMSLALMRQTFSTALDSLLPGSGKSVKSPPTGITELPWEHVHLVIDQWALQRRALPYRCSQFAVCTLRYALKIMRTRQELPTRCVLFLVLGMLCGAIMNESDPGSAPVFLIFVVAAFSSVIGTITLKSLGDSPIEREFFKHEQLLGVSQTVECLSRLWLDVIAFAILPLLFAAPLLGFTASHTSLGEIYVHFLMIAWAYTSIAYLAALLVPNNAAVLYVAVAFVLSTFLAGAFGLTVKSTIDAPGLTPPWVPCQLPAVCNGSRNTTADGELTDGYMDTDGYGYWAMMPGFWGLFTLDMLWAEALPYAVERDNLLFMMSNRYGYLPRSQLKVNAYERRDVSWFDASLVHLLGFGFVLRCVTVLLFVARNYSLKETLRPMRSLESVRATRFLTRDADGKMDDKGTELQEGYLGPPTTNGSRKMSPPHLQGRMQRAPDKQYMLDNFRNSSHEMAASI